MPDLTAHHQRIRRRGVNAPLYWAVRAVLQPLIMAWFRVRRHGREHVPRTGAVIVAANHRSFLDPFVIGCCVRRPVYFVAKRELFEKRLKAWILNALGAFPLRRDESDGETLETARAVLRRGDVVVIFPEGTRQSGPALQPLFEGAAYVAARTQVPIVPVGIGGSEKALPKGKKLPRPVKIHILVGEPLAPAPIAEGARHPSRRAVKELTVELQHVLQDLFDRAQRRAGVEVPVNQTSGPDVSSV